MNTAEFQARKTLPGDIIFAMKKNSVDLFRAAPYMFMSVLHKDAMFHSNFGILATPRLRKFQTPLETLKFESFNSFHKNEILPGTDLALELNFVIKFSSPFGKLN